MELKSMIDFVVTQTLLELRSRFKWDEFKKLDDLHAQKEYLDKAGTTKLGEGSSRVVYLLSNRFVLKLAQPDYGEVGRAQNKTEVKISHDPIAKDYVTQIFEYDSDYDWLVSELVRPLKSKEEFEKLTGVDFDIFKMALDEAIDWEGDLKNAVKEFRVKGTFAKTPEEAKKYKAMAKFLTSKWARGLVKLLLRNNVELGDIVLWDHWGKTPDGRVVILDYGFTDNVARRFYDFDEE